MKTKIGFLFNKEFGVYFPENKFHYINECVSELKVLGSLLNYEVYSIGYDDFFFSQLCFEKNGEWKYNLVFHGSREEDIITHILLDVDLSTLIDHESFKNDEENFTLAIETLKNLL